MRVHKKGLEGTASETSPSEINQVQNSISESQLKEFISIRKQFWPLYIKTGLISIEGQDGIHLCEEEFLATFPKYETNARKCGTYPEELSATFDGVRFFCIRRKEKEDEF